MAEQVIVVPPPAVTGGPQLGAGVEVYILLGLHVQPQLQKVQPQCLRVQPQLGRGPIVGLRVFAVSLGGRSSDLKGPSVGPRRPVQVREALCRPERAPYRLAFLPVDLEYRPGTKSKRALC